MRYLFISIFFLIISGSLCVKAQPNKINILRDSLESIQYAIPVIPLIEGWKVIPIRSQSEWNNIPGTLKKLLQNGKKNIEFRLEVNGLILPVRPNTIHDLNYPESNIRIINKGTVLLAEGIEFERSKGNEIIYFSSGEEHNQKFWVVPYPDFELDNMVVDSKGNEIPLREETKLVEGDIIKVKGGKNSSSQDDVWKFKVDLPDLPERLCKDFYVLMTRDWTSARHKVMKVQDGWLYYHLDSEDLHSERDPNVDWIQYGVRPRYTLINYPKSKGAHITEGKAYIPWRYRSIRINKGGLLLHMGFCNFNSFEINGFKLNGLGKCPIGVYHSSFKTGLFVHHNEFKSLSSLAINTAWCENVVFTNNIIKYTRVGVVDCDGKNTTISNNHLRNIGWMLNTRAIVGSGERLHICDNVIEDFNYAAIACGSRAANRDSVRLTYIIERNHVKLSEEYTNNYLQNTLADGGGIYIGPSCTNGIIRNNVVENINGIHSNRGIFLDDGAKNLAIYGNLIMNTDNSYDIDLRLSNGYAAGIPDHNTNNSIFQNIMTGGYRFQDAGEGSNCIGGDNVLLGIGSTQRTVVDLKHSVDDMTESGLDIETVMEKVPVDGFVKKQLKKKK